MLGGAVLALSLGSFAAAAETKSDAVNLDNSKYREFIKTVVMRPLTASELGRLSKLVEASPQDARGHYVLGLVLQRSGYIQLAGDEYERAWSLDKSFPEPFVLLAALKLKGGQADQAPQITDEALLQITHDAKAIVRLAVLMHVNHQSEQAARLYKRAEELDPSAPELASARAFALLSSGKFAEAITEADKAVGQESTRFLGLVAKGRGLSGLGRSGQALDCYREAFRIDHFDPDFNDQFSRLLVNRGFAEEAVEPMFYALAQTSSNYARNLPVKVRLKELLFELPPEKVAPIIDRVSRELSDTDNGANLHFALGDVYDRMGKGEQAMRQYEKGLSLNPQFARGYLRLGKDLELYRRDFQAAHEDYKKAYMLDVDDKEIKARYDRLTYRILNNKNDVSMRLKNWLLGGRAAKGS